MSVESRTFADIAKQTLAEYDIGEHTLTFIRHSDNATFKVKSADLHTYLLRIHVPVSKTMGTHGADYHAVYSELMWLEALNRDVDLILQTPVRNRAGGLVTQVSAPMTSVPINCTLLRWIDGHPYHRDLETSHTAHQIGEILATLHNHAGGWEIPEGFTRPNRDAGYFESVLHNHISGDQRRTNQYVRLCRIREVHCDSD